MSSDKYTHPWLKHMASEEHNSCLIVLRCQTKEDEITFLFKELQANFKYLLANL